MKNTQREDRLVDEIWDQLDNLRLAVEAFASGTLAAYKSMSVILRTLLTGSSSKQGLVALALPTARFYPLKRVPRNMGRGFEIPAEIVVVNDQGGELHYMAGNDMPFLGIEHGGVVLSKTGPLSGDVVSRTKVKSLWEVGGNRIALDPWLAQSFLRQEWTLASFIKCVAHKDGGAHFDPNHQLEVMESFGSIHRRLTECVSQYVLHEIKCQIVQAFPRHRRRVI